MAVAAESGTESNRLETVSDAESWPVLRLDGASKRRCFVALFRGSVNECSAELIYEKGDLVRRAMS